jgi:uncharacterized membrane protein
MMSNVRRYFISGLLIWAPILITLLVIKFLVDLFGTVVSLLPHRFQPDTIIGFHVPGINLFITLGVILLTGLIVANILGRRLMLIWDSLIGRIPLVRSVYSGTQQVLQTLFTPNGQSFRKVLLVEYPRAGAWTMAFQTGDATPEVQKLVGGEPMLSIYVPTTPNPTSGFLLLVAKSSVIELEMTVEQALKFVISLGVVTPGFVTNIKERAI